MSEIFNPNLPNQNSGGGDGRSILVLAILAFVILCSLLYFVNSKPGTPTLLNQLAASSTQDGSISKAATAPNQFGWLTVLATPLYLALCLVHEHLVSNWGWAIIVLTVIFNALMLWPRMMSMGSSLKMMRVQPKVDALKKRYAHLKMNDPKRVEMNAELMALYKAEGTNMYGGCLPMLLQTPLLFAYFRVLQNATELRHAHWCWLTDLSAPDPLHILPILIVLTMFLTQFITPSPGMDRAQRRMLAFVIPVIMGFTLWHYASGLALYWATGNIFNLTIQFGINRTRMGREMQAISPRANEGG
ncbi:YidC/Oxa1 family membrane protein insertase [Acidicapsa acidisoli]|uniref:YidC/Oxa1 family membrane protein insertase n=1 Tax=Acidicapsa acidisoli TaxID=1615681 RepID=UPI0021DFC122|nr:membrane protein insertase YidC [Acidicapsa acidisoli]